MIYFDHNATSPLCAAAREAWLLACERFPANPSSPHRMGSRADAALDEARHTASMRLGCSPLDIIWTSGATEANNALLFHSATDGSGEAWVSAIEHPSTLQAARKWFGNRLRIIPVTPQGDVNLNWLADRFKKSRPALVCIMAANNETGVLQPWREAMQLCREFEIPFACDAAQWIGKLPSVGFGKCDFITGCAHKFGGPVGVGFMKVPAQFRPLLVGGEQEDGRRAGTENLPGVLAMIAAWEAREQYLAEGHDSPRELWREKFIQSLETELSGVQVVGGGTKRLWNTVAALMPASADCRRRWVVKLDKAGIAASTGSACSSGKEKPSHVLTAMGYSSSDADRMLRFSSGWETTEQDWDALAKAIRSVSSSFTQTNLGTS